MTTALELTPEVKHTGRPGEVPDRIGTQCDRLFPEDILKRLDYEEINRVNPEPGVCRFCNKALPVRFIQISSGKFQVKTPVFQCDRAARLWERADDIREKRIAAALQRRKEIVESQQSNTPKRKESYF